MFWKKFSGEMLEITDKLKLPSMYEYVSRILTAEYSSQSFKAERKLIWCFTQYQ